jgi:dienelactone hydrolase
MRLAILLPALLVLTACEEGDEVPASIVTRVVEYADGDAKLKGYVAYDERVSATRPGVLVVHDWWGQGTLAKATAERLAAWGYVGFAVDMYGDAFLTEDPEVAQTRAGQFRGEGREAGRRRATAGLEALKAIPQVDDERLATLGFCFGGTVSLELAWSGAPLKAAVSFHGHPTTPAEGDALSAAILVLHGGDDPFVPREMLVAFEEAMKARQANWELVAYGGAVHSFTDPKADGSFSPGAKYHERAAARSFQRCRDFLRETLGR